MEKFWIWYYTDSVDYDGYTVIGADISVDFEKELWFELGKRMWRNHISIFQDHVKFMHNDIVNPIRIGISQYANNFREMHDLAKFLYPPSNKGDEYDMVDWNTRDK